MMNEKIDSMKGVMALILMVTLILSKAVFWVSIMEGDYWYIIAIIAHVLSIIELVLIDKFFED